VITVGHALGICRRLLADEGLETAGLEARLLVAEALQAAMTDVLGHPQRHLAPAERRRLGALLRRRLDREPMAYITRHREFWSLPINVTRATLIPRPDSETLVDAALAAIGDRSRPIRILDLGTGSGCLLLALLHECRVARGVGVDRSGAALEVARANAERLGLAARAAFVCGDWWQSLKGPFDVIMGNPPYLSRNDMAALARDVAAFEPADALSGGLDGLDSYRALIPGVDGILAPNGALILEVGPDIARTVADMVGEAGLEQIEIKHDLAGRQRCVAALAVAKRFEKKDLETKRFPTSVDFVVTGSRTEAPHGAADQHLTLWECADRVPPTLWL
jgi:release factor glutamine methyltransferase